MRLCVWSSIRWQSACVIIGLVLAGSACQSGSERDQPTNGPAPAPTEQGLVETAAPESVVEEEGGTTSELDGMFASDQAVRTTPFRITPSGSPVDGGTVVTIVGEAFSDGSSVEFNGAASPEVTFVNPQTILALVPPGEPGPAEVVIRRPDGHVITSVAASEESGSAAATDGTGEGEQLTSAFQYYVLPQSQLLDTDGDGLSDYQELAGWDVWVDTFALGFGVDTFGNVTRYTSISDPRNPDTDGDGVTDYEEFLNKIDALKRDTDGDDLNDFEELFRWFTIPTSVDSDGDSRSADNRLPPTGSLFDGAELKTVGFVDGVIISEVYEGEGNERAIEIYNNTADAVDLEGDGYALVFKLSDGTVQTLPLGKTGRPAATNVIVDNDASLALKAHGDAFAALPFDGDDIIELRKGDQVVDSFGGPMTPTEFGEPALDVQTPPAPAGFIAGYSQVQQSFKPLTTGAVSTVKVLLKNTLPLNAVELTMDVVDNETDELVASGSGFIPAAVITGGQPILLPFSGLSGPRVVYAGRTYRIELAGYLTSTGVPSTFQPAVTSFDVYPDGVFMIAPETFADLDLVFETYIEPALAFAPWGSGDTATTDNDLRRLRTVAAGDTDSTAPFDPAVEWSGAPLTDLNDLGRHSCGGRFRVIDVATSTSPTLDDTDGDGRTDYDEIDDPTRTSFIADLPLIDLQFVGETDIRLNIEYAEAIGESKEYGVTMTETTSTTRTTTDSVTAGVTVDQSFEYEVGVLGAKVKGTTAIGVSFEYSHQWSKEKTEEASQEYSQLTSDSRELTETAATGLIAMALQISNPGKVTYTVSNLTLLAMLPKRAENAGQVSQNIDDTLIPVATPRAAVDTVTLAPGETSAPIELSATEVNADLIRELLKDPHGLTLRAASFDLLDANGIDFDFIREVTVARTASVTFEFGDGTLRRALIPTNVNRTADGGYAGISMSEAMELLGYAEGDVENGYTAGVVFPGEPVRLESLLGRGYETCGPFAKRFWFLVANDSDRHIARDFDDMVLLPGDNLTFVYRSDADCDQVSDSTEQFLGVDQAASPNAADADGDGLTEVQEIVQGWDVTVTGQAARHTFSDPIRADADKDGLNDEAEKMAGTDPFDRDTDRDDIGDAQDQAPTVPALRLYVNDAQNALYTDGLQWGTAHRTLRQSLQQAQNANSDAISDNDVASIWVAAGQYSPDEYFLALDGDGDRDASFGLLSNVAIYGGFAGTETRRGERNPDPLSNQTVLTGDLNRNDLDLAATGFPFNLASSNRSENSKHVVVAFGVYNCVLDGFTITGGAADDGAFGAGLRGDSPVTFRNLLIAQNVNQGWGGAAGWWFGGDNNGPVFENIVFASNVAHTGGALAATSDFPPGASTIILKGCTFQDNHAIRYDGMDLNARGGAIWVDDTMRVAATTCNFFTNTADGDGGAIAGVEPLGPTLDIDACRFIGNQCITPAANSADAPRGGAIYGASAKLSVSNSLFFANQSRNWGGAIELRFAALATLSNCTLVRNRSLGRSQGGGIALEATATGSALVQNSILWHNLIDGDDAADDIENEAEEAQLFRVGSSGFLTVRTSIFNSPSTYAGFGNSGADPDFSDFEGGNLTLKTTSPAIDAGNNALDIKVAPGIQALGATLDLLGLPRVADGNADGVKQVDLGAFEFEGSEDEATSN